MTDRDRVILPDEDDGPTNDTETTPVIESDEPGPTSDALESPEPGPDAESIGPTAAPEPETLHWADSTAAFVLGVLPAEDAVAAGQEFARSNALQTEIAALLPVADILLSLYQTQPAPAAPAESVAVSAPVRTAIERPPAETGRARMAAARHPARTTLGGVTPSTILIVALSLVAAVGVLWALALSDRLSTKDDEIAALNRQLTEFRQAANASAFTLSRTEDAPEEARGTVFYSLADSKVLVDVSGLAELDEDRVYQVWFQRSDSTEWEPGPTFLVNEQGETVQRLPGETPTFVRIAISEEAAPGSGEPTGPFLLEGILAGANG